MPRRDAHFGLGLICGLHLRPPIFPSFGRERITATFSPLRCDGVMGILTDKCELPKLTSIKFSPIFASKPESSFERRHVSSMG
jgi:hypothetical protein